MSNVNPAQMADAPVYSQEHHEFLSSNAARLAEILRDYNPYLQLQFIPTAQRDGLEAPFRIWDDSPWKGGYTVKLLTAAEIENPQAVLEWLFEGDLSKNGLSDLMAKAKAKETAEQLFKLKREADIAAERQELASTLIQGGRDKKHTFRHGGKIFTAAGARDVSTTVH